MSEISNFLFKANKDILMKAFEEKCQEYNEDFIIKKIVRDKKNRIIGILIYFDVDCTRWILEGHCLSKNKFLFLKYWRDLFRDKNINCWKATVQKVNDRMIKFYKNMKFKTIAEDNINVYFELRGQLWEK